MVFRKIKRVWSHNNMNYIPKFRETFPELNKVSSEEMCDRWISLGIDFYTEEKSVARPFIRITLPLAFLFFIIMLCSLPIKFMFTGIWGYDLTDKSIVYNWFRELRLM